MAVAWAELLVLCPRAARITVSTSLAGAAGERAKKNDVHDDVFNLIQRFPQGRGGETAASGENRQELCKMKTEKLK